MSIEPIGNTSGNLSNLGIAALSGEWIYYTDYYSMYQHNISKIHIDGSSHTQLCSDYGQYINVIGDWVYYQNRGDGQEENLYKIRTDGSEKTKITDEESLYVHVVNDWAYYVVSSGTNLRHRGQEGHH